MSTIHASNYGDGTTSAPFDILVASSIKSRVKLYQLKTPPDIEREVNISSVTDYGAGVYRFTFTSAFVDNGFSTAYSTTIAVGAMAQVVRNGDMGATFTDAICVRVDGTGEDAAYLLGMMSGELA